MGSVISSVVRRRPLLDLGSVVFTRMCGPVHRSEARSPPLSAVGSFFGETVFSDLISEGK